MRLSLIAAMALLASPSFALACGVTIGDVTLEQGDVESTSVVKGTNAEAVLTSDGEDKIEDMYDAMKDGDTVAVKVGSYTATIETKKVLVDDDTIQIPGKNTSDGLVLQQEFKRCI